MAKKDANTHIGRKEAKQNCNWQPQWEVDTQWPLQTCDDLHRIYQHFGINFVAKEDFLNVGLRGCPGVNYALLIREPLDRLVSHIKFGKFTPTQVDEWSRGESTSTEEKPKNPKPQVLGRVALVLFVGTSRRSQTERRGCVQIFNDMTIRMLLGEDVYFSPFGSINASHVVNAFTRLGCSHPSRGEPVSYELWNMHGCFAGGGEAAIGGVRAGAADRPTGAPEAGENSASDAGLGAAQCSETSQIHPPDHETVAHLGAAAAAMAGPARARAQHHQGGPGGVRVGEATLPRHVGWGGGAGAVSSFPPFR
jgi:hypothetical protein